MKKNKKSSHAGMVHVDHDMFTNKDGFPNGGVEVEVSNVCDWREKYKRSFQENEGQKLTFTPIFISAVVKSLKDFPILNSSIC